MRAALGTAEGGDFMNIALIAHGGKKESIIQFCIAYEEILKQHILIATSPTANVIMQNSNLRPFRVLSGYSGGDVQIASRVAYDEIDLVVFLIDHEDEWANDTDVSILLRQCDIHNVPVATNIATAEVLIRGLQQGDFGWREIIHGK